MKYSVYLILSLMVVIKSFAQLRAKVDFGNNSTDKFTNQINIRQVDGRPFKQKYTDVVGSPFWKNQYITANWFFADNSIVLGVKTKIDICSQEILFIDAANKESLANVPKLKYLIFSDSTDSDINNIKIQNGFPPFENITEKDFFSFEVDGKISLLKILKKTIRTEKNELTGDLVKEFQDYDDYYLLNNGQLSRFKKDKNSITQLWGAKTKVVEQFITENKLNVKNIKDFTQVLNYYNQLIQ